MYNCYNNYYLILEQYLSASLEEDCLIAQLRVSRIKFLLTNRECLEGNSWGFPSKAIALLLKKNFIRLTRSSFAKLQQDSRLKVIGFG